MTAWQDMVKASRALSERKARIGDRAVRLAYQQAAKHHPETGGHPLMVHNWGNEAARAVWNREAARMRRVGDYCDREYRRIWKAAISADRAA